MKEGGRKDNGGSLSWVLLKEGWLKKNELKARNL